MQMSVLLYSPVTRLPVAPPSCGLGFPCCLEISPGAFAMLPGLHMAVPLHTAVCCHPLHCGSNTDAPDGCHQDTVTIWEWRCGHSGILSTSDLGL